MRQHITRAFALATLITLAGCGASADTSGGGNTRHESVTVTLVDQSIFADVTTTASATYRDASGAPIAASFTWSSSNERVATVNSSGKVTAVAPGATSIAASTLGVTGSAGLTVTTSPVAHLFMTPPSVLLTVGSTSNVNAAAYDSQDRLISGLTVVYTSSNQAIASVTPTGLATGNALGSAAITATVGGKTATSTVTVIATP